MKKLILVMALASAVMFGGVVLSSSPPIQIQAPNETGLTQIDYSVGFSSAAFEYQAPLEQYAPAALGIFFALVVSLLTWALRPYFSTITNAMRRYWRSLPMLETPERCCAILR